MKGEEGTARLLSPKRQKSQRQTNNLSNPTQPFLVMREDDGRHIRSRSLARGKREESVENQY